MAYKKKCPSCNSCLDIVWLMPRRFYHCWLEDTWYDIVDNVVTLIDIEETTGIPKEVLDNLMESYGKE